MFRCIFRNLTAALVRNHISKRSAAALLGVSYNTFTSKMRCEHSFTLDEAFKLQALLAPDDTLDFLFEKTEGETERGGL